MDFLLFGHIITLFSSDNKAAFTLERFFCFYDSADGSLPYVAVCHFHRQAGNNLESGELRGNMRVALLDERRKTLDLIFTFFQNAFSFRSRKVVVSFPPPEKRIFSADIKGERLYGFEVIDFGYSSCR